MKPFKIYSRHNRMKDNSNNIMFVEQSLKRLRPLGKYQTVVINTHRSDKYNDYCGKNKNADILRVNYRDVLLVKRHRGTNRESRHLRPVEAHISGHLFGRL